MIKVVNTYCFIFLFFLASLCCRADQVAGGNISYLSIGGNQYVLSLNLYKNCSSPSFSSSSISVNFASNIGCNTSFTTLFALTDSLDASQICSSQQINSSCNGGTVDGTKIYIYTDTVALIACNDWIVFFETNYRDSGAININNSETTPFRIEARINTLDVIGNNSPVISTQAIPYVCENQPVSFNMGFNDPEGDSLSYSLVAAQYGSSAIGIPVVYNFGYSDVAPINGISINPQSGQIDFTPTLVGCFVVVVQCSEYRGGVMIGTTQVDFEFVVQVCTVSPPQADLAGISILSGNATVVNSKAISVCEGNNFCAEIEFSASNLTNNIVLSSNISSLLPGAIFTQTGTNPAMGQICWTADSPLENIYIIVFAQDDACPIYGFNSFDFVLNVHSGAYAGSDQLICAGSSITLNANGDSTNNWTAIGGEPLVIGTNFSCNSCQNPMVSPSISSEYSVEMPSIISGCPQKDTVKVIVALEVDTLSLPETCAGVDGSVNVNVSTGSGNYAFDWGSGIVSEDLINVSSGAYAVLINDLGLGCSKTLNFNVGKLNFPTADAGADTSVCGLGYLLSANTSFGDSTWLFTTGAVFSDSANPNAFVTVSSYGLYTFYWSENNGFGCISMDSVQVNFIQPLVANAGTNDSICGLTYTLNAAISTGSGVWNLPPGLTIPMSEINNPNAEVTATSFNTYTIEWIESSSGLCADTSSVLVTFLGTPNTDAGSDTSVCGLNYNLNAIASFGSGKWNAASGIIFADSSVQNTIVTSSLYGVFDLIWTENNFGCVNADTLNINFVEQPVANAGFDDYTCGNQYLLNANFGVGSGAWISTSPFISFADSSAENTTALLDTSQSSYGLYDLFWIKDNNFGCKDTDTIVINFTEPPIAFAGNDTAVCGINLSLSATSNMGVGAWTSPTAFINFSNPSNGNTAVGLDTAIGAYGTYPLIWTVYNTLNCIDVDTVNVTFIQQPIVMAGADQIICGAISNVSATSNIGSGIWTANSPFISFANSNFPNTQVIFDSINGNYGSYMLTWRSSNGICSYADSVVFTFIQKTFANAGTDRTVCGVVDTLNALPSSGAGTWSSINGGVLFSEINNPNSACTLDTSNFLYGTHFIVWSEQNDILCITSDTLAITFNQQPIANAGSDIFVCDNNATLNAIASIGLSTWEAANSIFFTDSSLSTTFLYSLNYDSSSLVWTENNFGCIDSDTINITFTKQPFANACLDDFICGNQYPLNASYDVGNGFWVSTSPYISFDNYSEENTTTTLDTALGAYGTYELFWIKDNSFGCTDVDTVLINFVEQPISFAGIDKFTCGKNTNLNASAAVGIGTWSSPNLFVTFSNSNDPNSSITLDTAFGAFGNYPIVWKNDNGFGCIDSDTVWINFVKEPIANAGNDQAICVLQGDPMQTTLQANPTAAAGFWVGSAGTTISSPSSATTAITASTYGIKQFIWTETNLPSCSDADTVLINFIQQPIANASPDTAVCGLTTSISAAISVGAGIWTAQAGVSVNQLSNTTAIFTASSYGIFTVYYTITNESCIAKDSLKIKFKEIPVSNAGPDDDICGFCYTMQAVPSIGIGSWGGPSGTNFSSAVSPSTYACVDSVYGSKLFIWVENNDGCISAPDFVIINFVEVPTVYAGKDTIICGLNYTMQADAVAGSGEWTIPAGTAVSNIYDEAAQLNVANYGSYQFIWRALNSLGCDNSDTVTITFLEMPMANAGSDSTLCGNSIQLNANLNLGIGTWNALQTGINFDNSSIFNATVTAPYGDYKLVWTAINSVCLQRDTINISFVEIPVSDAGMDDEICGLSYLLNANQSVGTGQWSGDVGVSFSPNNLPNTLVTVPSYGSYTLYWKENNGGGCVDSSSVMITFNDIPQIQSLTHQCMTQDLYYQIDFDVVGGESSTVGFENISGLFTGNHFTSDSLVNGSAYSFSITDSNNCGISNYSGSFTCPNNTFAGTMAIDTIYGCGISEITAIHNGDNTMDANDAFEYVLHNSNTDTIGIIFSISTNGIFTYNTSLNLGEVYYLSPLVGNNDGFGFVNMNDPLISVGLGTPVVFYDNPSVVFSSDTTVCEGIEVNLLLQFTGNSPWQYSYALNGTPMSTINTLIQTDTITVTLGGNYEITQISDQHCTIFSSAAAVVNHIPLPMAVMVGGGNVCEGDSLPLQINIASNGDWQLMYSINGENQDTIVGIEPSFSFNAELNGNYSVNYISDNFCSNYQTSNEIEINVIELPVAFAGEDLNLCSGNSGQLGVVPSPDYTYFWNNALGLSSTEISNPTLTVNTLNLLILTYSVTVTGAGCSASDQTTMTIYPYPIPIPSTDSITICAGENVQLYAVGGGTYQWQPDSLMDNYNSPSPTAIIVDTTNFYVTVDNGFGCVTVDTITVNTLPLPNVQFSANSQYECAPAEIVFTNESTPLVSSTLCQWSFNNGTFSNLQFPSPVAYEDSGYYDISLLVRGQNGCTNSLTKEDYIKINATQAEFIFSPTTADIDFPFIAFQNQSPPSNYSIWDFGDNSFSYEKNPTHKYDENNGATYTACLESYSIDGCMAKICYEVIILPRAYLFVPNTFSPNGDGINDLMAPSMVGFSTEKYTFTILNRRGRIIFETHDINEKWDGAGENDDYLDEANQYTWKIAAKTNYSVAVIEYTGKFILLR